MKIALIVPDNKPDTQFGETYILRFLGKALHNLNNEVYIFGQDEIIPACDLIISGCLTWDPRPYKKPKIYWCFSALMRILSDQGAYINPDFLNAYDAYLIPSFHATLLFRKKYRPKPVDCCVLAADPDFFKFKGVSEEYQCDLAFVGSRSGRGEGNIFPEMPKGMLLKIWGHDWSSDLKNYFGWADINEVPKIYSSARAVMGHHKMEFRQSGFMVSRVFEVLSTGARFFSDMPVGMGELFTNMKDLVWYDSPHELSEILKIWQKDPQKFGDIGINVREKILKNHTYTHRAKFIMDFAERNFFR